jgi:hypothetical protein
MSANDKLYESKSFFRQLLITLYRVDHKVVRLGANKKLFCDRTIFQKFNFEITARALPVIPPKFTGVLITQPEKIILMKKYCFAK